MNSKSRANLPRILDAAPGRYEVWYLTFNQRASGAGFWIRYTLHRPIEGDPQAKLWCSHFPSDGHPWGICERRPWPANGQGRHGLALDLQDAGLADGSARGGLAGAGHEASWDLVWASRRGLFRHLPRPLYQLPLADTLVLSPYVHARFSGWVKVDGRRYELKDDPGCQSHLWGRAHAWDWAWAHCSAFVEDPGAVLEVISARPARLRGAGPALTFAALCHRGRWLRFNGLHHLALNRGRYEVGQYRFVAQGATARLEGQVSVPMDRLLRADYLDPAGTKIFCHNSERASCRIDVLRRTAPGLPWRIVDRLSSGGSTHAEWGGRAAHPGVFAAITQLG